MKLRQNAKELVLIEADGLGLILGEVRYNRQTETVLFALEKAAFFDLYFPCTVLYDQERGPVVHDYLFYSDTAEQGVFFCPGARYQSQVNSAVS